MRKSFYYPVILCFSLIFIACQKEVTQELTQVETGQQALSAIAIKWMDSLTNLSFVYDNQKHLTSISGSNNNGMVFKTELCYDSQGRMVSATDTSSYNARQTYTFSYDNKGRIVQKIGMANPNVTYAYRRTYAYDLQGRLIADTTHGYWVNDIFEYTSYTYDQHDNIVEVKIFRKDNGTFRLEKSAQLQYDTKLNPYYPLRQQLYFLQDYADGNEFILTKNNAVTKNYPDGTIVTYTYQYNSNNLPTRYSEVDNTDPEPTIYNFYY